ncbi:MAG: hypothetical protein DMG06_29780, partial [Acidobacteria bacterium]
MENVESLGSNKKRTLSVLLLFFLFVVPGYGQDIATKGAIGGRIVDQTGAVLPGSKVTVIGPEGERRVTANQTGEFDVPNLIPGRYTVKAELAGFKSVSLPNVEVFVGKTSALKITLNVGNVTEVVVVEA